MYLSITYVEVADLPLETSMSLPPSPLPSWSSQCSPEVHEFSALVQDGRPDRTQRALNRNHRHGFCFLALLCLLWPLSFRCPCVLRPSGTGFKTKLFEPVFFFLFSSLRTWLSIVKKSSRIFSYDAIRELSQNFTHNHQNRNQDLLRSFISNRNRVTQK